MERFVRLEPGQSEAVESPHGSLSIERRGESWILDFEPAMVQAAPGLQKAFSMEVFPSDSAGLWLRWRLPSLPCMFRFGRPLSLAPDARSSLSFALPLSLSVEDSMGSSFAEIHHPSFGRAWYGQGDGGEEALHLACEPSIIGSFAESAVAEPGAGLPVLLRNDSKRRVDLPRLTIPLRLLRLWDLSGKRLTDRVTISYEPDDDIRISTGDLKIVEPRAGLVLIHPPRDSRPELLLRKGMQLLRDLAGWEAR